MGYRIGRVNLIDAFRGQQRRRIPSGNFECFVGEHGILFWTETAELYGDDLETMKLEIDLMQQAFELPILDYDDGKLLKE